MDKLLLGAPPILIELSLAIYNGNNYKTVKLLIKIIFNLLLYILVPSIIVVDEGTNMFSMDMNGVFTYIELPTINDNLYKIKKDNKVYKMTNINKYNINVLNSKLSSTDSKYSIN